MTGIYRITSPSGKVYIGQSRDLHRRHNIDYKYHNCVNQRVLYASIKKYSWEKHECIILQEFLDDISTDSLNYFEQTFIDWYTDIGYSMMNTKKVASRWLGKHTETAIDRIRKGNTGKIVSQETREKLRKVGKEKRLSDKELDRLRTCNIGRQHTEEWRKLMKIKMTGRKHSKETLQKMREASTGREVSKEAREKMRLAKLGKPSLRKGTHTGKQIPVQCPHCNKEGGPTGMYRYHFNNCKERL